LVEVEKNRSVEIEVEAAKVKPFVVVGIPAFNEEKTIARVVVRAQDHADKVVVCDDGSSDLTAEIAERLGAEVLRHKENLGYGAAIQSLFKRARELGADVLVTLDADGQHDPSEVPNAVKPIVDGVADVVVGNRFLDKRLAYTMPWYRRAGVKFLTKLTNNGVAHGVEDAQSGFRAYDRKSLENLVLFEDGMGVSAEILINARKQGLRICEVSSSCSYKNGDGVRTSTHNPVKHFVDVVMSIVRLVVEERPLTVLGLPGVLCLIAGVLFGVWMLQIYAIEHRIVTNIALASLAFVLVGFFAIFTAVTLYAITRILRKINGKNN
jgi:glycosyltransferase involved in cell wall biosynthesis